MKAARSEPFATTTPSHTPGASPLKKTSRLSATICPSRFRRIFIAPSPFWPSDLGGQAPRQAGSGSMPSASTETTMLRNRNRLATCPPSIVSQDRSSCGSGPATEKIVMVRLLLCYLGSARSARPRSSTRWTQVLPPAPAGLFRHGHAGCVLACLEGSRRHSLQRMVH